MGSGLVVVRGDRGDWSPPSALAMASVGWGLQAGGALHDLLIVLRNRWVLLLLDSIPACLVSGQIRCFTHQFNAHTAQEPTPFMAFMVRWHYRQVQALQCALQCACCRTSIASASGLVFLHVSADATLPDIHKQCACVSCVSQLTQSLPIVGPFMTTAHQQPAY